MTAMGAGTATRASESFHRPSVVAIIPNDGDTRRLVADPVSPSTQAGIVSRAVDAPPPGAERWLGLLLEFALPRFEH